MSAQVPLDKIYTAEEAAERLRLSVRGTIKLGRKHGLCSRVGRSYLFSESDLLSLWQIQREPAQSPRAPTVVYRSSGPHFLDVEYRKHVKRSVEREVLKEHRAAERNKRREMAAKRQAEKRAQREERVRRMNGWLPKPEGRAEDDA